MKLKRGVVYELNKRYQLFGAKSIAEAKKIINFLEICAPAMKEIYKKFDELAEKYNAYGQDKKIPTKNIIPYNNEINEFLDGEVELSIEDLIDYLAETWESSVVASNNGFGVYGFDRLMQYVKISELLTSLKNDRK